MLDSAAAVTSLLIGFGILGGLIVGGAPVLLVSWVAGAITAAAALGGLLLGYRAALVRQVSRVRDASTEYVVGLSACELTLRWLETNRLMPVYTIHNLALSSSERGVTLWTGIGQPIKVVTIQRSNVLDVTVSVGAIVFHVLTSNGVESQLSVLPRIPGRRIVHVPSQEQLIGIVAELKDSMRSN